MVWSLAYEMVFYLMITALFLGGVHRRSSRYALVFAAAAVGLSGLLVPESLSHDLLTPGVVVAITDSLILAGLALTLAGRGRTRIAGAVLAALTGLLLIVFNSGFAAPWETFTIFALMFTGTMLYRAEAGQYPWRRALYVTVLVFGLTLVAVQWHVSPLAENVLAIRKTFNTLELAGLTFAVAMLCRHKRMPRALAWLGLISYSVYLLHPALIEVYDSVPWTRNQNFVPTELLLVAVFVLVLLACCGLTHRFIEAPMQRLGRRVARRLDARFGPDSVAASAVRRRRPSAQRNETLVPVRSNALESRFHGVRHDGYLAWPSLLPGSAAMPIQPTFLPRFRLAFREIPGTIPPCAGTGDRRVIGCQARSRARPGEAASPAAAPRRGTLGSDRWLPNATDSIGDE